MAIIKIVIESEHEQYTRTYKVTEPKMLLQLAGEVDDALSPVLERHNDTADAKGLNL